MTDAALGRLRAVTIVCPDYPTATAAYRDYLGYQICESGRVDAALADAWGAPLAAGARFAWLVPASGADVGIRLIEGPNTAPFRPYSAWGWNAIEIAVSDCDRAVAQLAQGPFQVVGAPAELGFSAGALRAGQLVGPSGEVLYLTEIRHQVPGFVLPPAQCLVDQPFIVILHAGNAASAIQSYADQFGNLGTDVFQFPVEFMAQFQGLPQDHPYTLGTVALAGGGYFEIEGAPAHIGPRQRTPGHLPPGIAMVTVEGGSSAAVPSSPGPLHAGATARRLDGVAGEWLEVLRND